jgi:hypothetical protein
MKRKIKKKKKKKKKVGNKRREFYEKILIRIAR